MLEGGLQVYLRMALGSAARRGAHREGRRQGYVTGVGGGEQVSNVFSARQGGRQRSTGAATTFMAKAESGKSSRGWVGERS